ncbi:hypothetical protein BRADI_2g21872v3 [Brachypodium distachyon]|uniref:Uncharacterized protein n=1 Tax=Brachypodium distachyon TaxID=15368 RepID=A0A2K2D9R6_BRADI|nr:hypothetical protein BRADI_2g21872v3 [Brachypodium distachyon]
MPIVPPCVPRPRQPSFTGRSPLPSPHCRLGRPWPCSPSPPVTAVAPRPHLLSPPRRPSPPPATPVSSFSLRPRLSTPSAGPARARTSA